MSKVVRLTTQDVDAELTVLCHKLRLAEQAMAFDDAQHLRVRINTALDIRNRTASADA